MRRLPQRPRFWKITTAVPLIVLIIVLGDAVRAHALLRTVKTIGEVLGVAVLAALLLGVAVTVLRGRAVKRG